MSYSLLINHLFTENIDNDVENNFDERQANVDDHLRQLGAADDEANIFEIHDYNGANQI